MIYPYIISFLQRGACYINASKTCKMNDNAISNCSVASSGGLCPSIDSCWVGGQVRWQSHPLGRGVYILDDTYFTALQRGVFDTVNFFLKLACSRGTMQKAKPWTIARWPVQYAFSSVELRDQHSWYRLWNVNPWIWEGFTFGRINSLSSYDKRLLHRLFSKTRHFHPFALLFLLICICLFYPLT